MTDLTPEAVKAALEAATPGPWAYRPHKYDDWGYVRGPDRGEDRMTFICQAKDNRVTDQGEVLARVHGVDPWEANARLIAMAPDLATAYLAAMEENGREQRHAEEWMLAARVMEQKLSLMAEENEHLRKRIDAADRLATEAQGLHADGLRVTSRALDIALATYRATEAKP